MTVTHEIGVLVPMRLETRFVNRGRNWSLRVRVVPDAMSITNHDDIPSALELDAVEAMWRQAGSPNLETANGRAAWQGLASLVGAEQAAWLARTFPPQIASNGDITVNRPAVLRTELNHPRTSGLPPTMELWLSRGGQPAQRVVTLTPIAAEVQVDLDDSTATRAPWWTSFTEAVRVGMAAEIDLGTVADDIDTLYLVGIGGPDPGALLAAQADSGRLGVIAPGSATSSVDGQAAVSFGGVDDWRRLVKVRASQQPGANAVRVAMGAPSTLPGVVGGDQDHRGVNGSLVGALWPSLWGHALGNVWAEGSRADDLGVWAADNLVPEGPLPALRVDNQPFGILPATSLRRWQAAAGDPAVEAALVPLVLALVTAWANTTERLAGGSNPLQGLVRNPSAASYAWRWMMPTELAAAVSFRYAEPVTRSDLNMWWDQQAPTVRLSPGAAPARRLVAAGWAQQVDLGLATPKELPAGSDLATSLAQLADATVPELVGAGTSSLVTHASPPWGRSLLTELARHALLTSAATVARNVAAQPRALVEPLGADTRTPTQVEVWAARLQPGDLKRRDDSAVTVHNNVRAALGALAGHTSDDIERALRALLETATNRIDPWATAIAWRRMQSLATAPRSLGAYSWVDSPRPRGTTPSHQFVLAPSKDQASVTAMMRDRALNVPDSAQWQADLTSDAVRGALRLAAETREGSHPADTLGRMVERIVARPTVIDRLRDQFPTTTGFAFIREFRIRRTCNGPAVLDAATASPGTLLQLGVTAAQVTALADLDAAVDALADLHLAEAALGVVKHRPALVSAASSAAAGESPPPQFTFPDTPTTGVAVDSVAVVVLPDVATPMGRNASPAAIADAAVAAYLDDHAGPADDAGWTWTQVDANGQESPLTLADIGLRPCDTLGLAIGNLRDTLIAASGAAGLKLKNPPGPAVVHTLGVALAGVPATRPDVGSGAESPAVATDLAGRYARLRGAADTAIVSARATTAAGSNDQDRRRELARLARWGITPMAGDTTGASLVDRVAGAADVLDQRVSTMPAQLDGAAIGVLTKAIVDLVGPEAGFPVFARLPKAAFTGVRAEPVRVGQALRLDPDWLETVATVRPALARLEAAQLGERVRTGGEPLRAWTSHPGDPWQTAVATAPADDSAQPSRLVAVFGPVGALPTRPTATTAGKVAAAVIDRFAETIPDTDHIASAAFPHDLPVARAPQAVLLAVPPDLAQPLDTETLVDIVAEVRDLARSRMGDAASVGVAASALHLAAIPAVGRTAVDLGGDR